MSDSGTTGAMALVRKHLEAAGEDQLREMVKTIAEELMQMQAEVQSRNTTFETRLDKTSPLGYLSYRL